MDAVLKSSGLSADEGSKRSADGPGGASGASDPANTTMTSRHDEGSPPERTGGDYALQPEKSPDVTSFAPADLVGKPLVAFEPLAAHIALPLTWGPGTFRTPAHAAENRAAAS